MKKRFIADKIPAQARLLAVRYRLNSAYRVNEELTRQLAVEREKNNALRDEIALLRSGKRGSDV